MPTNNPIFIYHEWYEEHDKLSYRQQEVLESIIEKNQMLKRDAHWYADKKLPWGE